MPSVVAPCLAPKPPPMNSQVTCTRSGSRSKARANSARASQMPCVDTNACSSSPSHCATPQCGSSAWCTWAAVAYSASTITSASAMPASTSPALVLDRILLQALLGQRLGCVGDEAEHRVARRQRLDAGARRLGGLAGERGHRRAREGRLALEDRVAALLDVGVGGREHREHARHGARGLDVELDRRVRVRRAHDRRRAACRAARRRRRSARRPRPGAGRSGA